MDELNDKIERLRRMVRTTIVNARGRGARRVVEGIRHVILGWACGEPSWEDCTAIWWSLRTFLTCQWSMILDALGETTWREAWATLALSELWADLHATDDTKNRGTPC